MIEEEQSTDAYVSIVITLKVCCVDKESRKEEFTGMDGSVSDQ